MLTESRMRPKKTRSETHQLHEPKKATVYDERISAEKNQLMKKERIVMSVPVSIVNSREQSHPFEKMSLQTLKVHKNKNFFGFDFEFCTISLLVTSKY
jgi:hypothetical protein